MKKKEIVLKLNVAVLLLIGIMDFIRGFAHTFNVRYAAVQLAGIEPIPDSLYLMGAFGISNFLTGSIYFLVIWKAKHLAPYILLLIPLSYFLGGLGITYQQVEPEGQFVGRNMLSIYLSSCLLSSLFYFTIELLSLKRMAKG